MVTWKEHLSESPIVGARTRRKLSAKRAFRDAKANARRQGFLDAIAMAQELNLIDMSAATQLTKRLDEVTP